MQWTGAVCVAPPWKWPEMLKTLLVLEMVKTLLVLEMFKTSSVWRNRSIKTRQGLHGSHFQNGTKLWFSFGKLFWSQSTSYVWVKQLLVECVFGVFAIRGHPISGMKNIFRGRSPSCCSLHSSPPLGWSTSQVLMLKWSNSPETKQGWSYNSRSENCQFWNLSICLGGKYKTT